MPKARIITSSPHLSQAVAERLRARGYAVETVAPDDVPDQAADLEIVLAEANIQEVLNELSARTVPDWPDVFIAAGSLHPAVVSDGHSTAGPEPPSVADTMNGVAAGLQNKRDLLAKALREQRAILRQARIAERQRARGGEVLRAERYEYIHGDSEHSAMQLPSASAPELNAEVVPSSPVRSVSTESSQPESIPYEQVAARSSDVQPAEVQPAQDGAHSLASGTPAMAQGPVVGATTTAPSHTESMRLRRGAVRVVIPGGRRLSRRARELRTAVLISCLFAGLLMLGWAAVTRGPVSPLPKGFSAQTGVEEAIPFGAATVKLSSPRAGTGIDSHMKSLHQVPGAVPSSSRDKHEARVAAAGENRAESKTQKRHRLRDPEDDIAEDEVIIHRMTGVPQPAESEKASLKKFSD